MDLLAKVNKLGATNLDLRVLTASKVVTLHQLPSRAKKIPGVIVRFLSHYTRDNCLDRKSRLRATDKSISKNMTRHTRTHFATVRDFVEQKGHAYTWYNNGKVFLRKKDGDRPFVIKTPE